MRKYNVHFVVYASYDIDVEANSETEAKTIARKEYECASLGDFDFVDEVDVYTEKL